MRNVFFIVLGLVVFFVPLGAHAYLTDETDTQCGTLTFVNDAFFVNGYRLFSAENWREPYKYIGERVCASGYLEKDGTTHKAYGISFHELRAFNEAVNEAVATPQPMPMPTPAPQPVVAEPPIMLLGLVECGSFHRTYLRLNTGLILLSGVRCGSLTNVLDVYGAVGTPLLRNDVVVGLRDPILIDEQYFLNNPPFVDEQNKPQDTDILYTEPLQEDGLVESENDDLIEEMVPLEEPVIAPVSETGFIIHNGRIIRTDDLP